VIHRPTALRVQDAERYRREGYWTSETVGAGFARICAAHGDKLAIIDGATRLRFNDLDALSQRLAQRFAALGVGAGDVVAYQLPNWWETVVIFLAAARIGAVANPLLPIFRERELTFILNQAQPKILCIAGRFRGVDHRALIDASRTALPSLAHVFVVRDDAPAGMQRFPDLLHEPSARGGLDPITPSVDAASTLLLMYTSGTTAEPKGVLHTHHTLAAEIRSLAHVHQLTPADTTLMPSPLTHISGLIHAILVPALLGTAAVLMDRWDPAQAIELIATEGVTYMIGAPTFLQDLLAAQRAPHDVRRLRLFSCGGADVSADLIRRARHSLGCVAKRAYGSTEFPTITTTDAGDADAMGIETEGRVIPPGALRIVDDAGDVCAPGSEGEVQARGPECCVGYSDERLNRDAFTADGWFRTGDLGTVDAAGYLRITGRIKDIVIRKGEKLSVREIEDAIAHHPAVAEVAVVAVPDAATGERACAVIVPHPGQTLTLRELSEFLGAQGLARQKCPEELVIEPSLPRTDSGKIHRAAIKAALAKPFRD
jgi:cyclohexanecarboxylate-CoA ligase